MQEAKLARLHVVTFAQYEIRPVRQLPGHANHLADANFFTLLLYNDIYQQTTPSSSRTYILDKTSMT